MEASNPHGGIDAARARLEPVRLRADGAILVPGATFDHDGRGLRGRRLGHNHCAGGARSDGGSRLLGSPTRTFISMEATQRRDRLVGLLAAYGDIEVVGAEVADHRALRAILARHPDVLVMAPRRDGLGKAAWLARRGQEGLPAFAIVAAARDAPGAPAPGDLQADRRLPSDASLRDLIEAVLHASRARHRRAGRGAGRGAPPGLPP